MLISMPTGTSTILGAFQAIRLSFLNRTTFALTDKVTRIAKFASGIFVAKNLCLFHVATRKRFSGQETTFGSKWREIKHFAVA
jgi:hypothetical protein